jgi:hypothetical protein
VACSIMSVCSEADVKEQANAKGSPICDRSRAAA